MKVISFVSLKGGTGRTTLTAAVAQLLTEAGHRCVALDLDPQNALAAHFGCSPGERAGLAPGFGSDAALLDPLESACGVPLIPFGFRTPEELLEGEDELVEDPAWLRRRLEELLPAGTRFLLVDTPPHHRILLQEALAASELIVVTHLPDAASYATLPRLQQLLEPYQGQPDEGSSQIWHLINQMDGRSLLARDVAAVLGRTLEGALLPFTVPRDEAVPEALALQRPLVEHRPDCRALQSMQQLAVRIAELPAAAERTSSTSATSPPTPRAVTEVGGAT